MSGFAGGSNVNGPGRRVVVWVQGCTLHCPGCFNPLTHSAEGPVTPVEALAQRVLSARTAETCGLSFSGGEPFQQALALADLARRVRGAWPEVSLLAFTGYTLEDLRGASAPTGSASLLAQLDLLVDGPYLREAETVRPWRASANQRLWVLGRRTEKSFKNAPLATEIQAEIQVEPDGRVLLSGFPDAALRRAIRELAR